ncbi:tripartite tricarboxylate transporter permease [Candidatus Micrarchaeota archaeon]|nr:tripartite tricarboxylate transporter permease [Candidatus Micrarchaeota archaeon]
MNPLLFVFIGILVGILGIFPFIHTNLLMELAKGFFSDSLALGLFAAGVAFSHLVFESIPVVFFCIPSADQGVTVLPAHKLVLEGKGFLALNLVLSSFFHSLLLSFILFPFVLILLPPLFTSLKPLLLPVLLLLLIAFFLSEKTLGNILLSASIFLLSGLFGFFSFSFSSDALFPLLTGLFGVSSILLSLQGRSEFPKQEEAPWPGVSKKLVFTGCVLGSLSVLFPAINPALLSALVFIFLECSPESFLVLNSSLVASKLFFDFVAVFTIGKARTGAAVVLKDMLHSSPALLLIVIATAVSFFLSLALLLLTYRRLVGFLYSFNFLKLNLFFLLVLSAAVFFTSGFAGLFIMAFATPLGLLPPLLKLKRSYSMGALIVPSLLYFSGLNYFIQGVLS